MMEDPIARLLKHVGRKDMQREVEEELRFHLELRTQEYLRQGMTMEDARDEALKRFGNVEQIRNQCVEISRRSHPLMRALKFFLNVVFLVGVLARIFSSDIYGTQIGNMLILIAALGRFLLYVRGVSFSNLNLKNEILSPLRLNDNGQMTIAATDRRTLTPVERVISDE